MRRIVCVVVVFILPLLSGVAENSGALDALRVLPKAEINNLARIEAYDGTPLPERWHFLVHDPNAKSGLREYIVVGGELAATRGVSQFAESLNETDVIGSDSLNIDSRQLAQMAKRYAATNKIALTKISYHLHKQPDKSEPLWRVNCYSDGDRAIAALVVKATDGTVLAHEGFAARPSGDAKDTGDRETATSWETDSEETPIKARSRSSVRKTAIVENKVRRKTTSAEAKSGNDNRRKARTAAKRNSSEGISRQFPVEAPPPFMARESRNPIRNFFRRFAR